MKTSDKIKATALQHFNQTGVRNVTLRQVAAALEKSYGNITYHFPNKTVLVQALYADMVAELGQLSATLKNGPPDLFRSILQAPAASFPISFRYRFFFKDYVEIMRNFPEVADGVRKSRAARKQGLLPVLQALVTMGVFRPELEEADLFYIMELSGAMRTKFMMELSSEVLPSPEIERDFAISTNQLLWPYLTDAGQQQYRDWKNAF